MLKISDSYMALVRSEAGASLWSSGVALARQRRLAQAVMIEGGVQLQAIDPEREIAHTVELFLEDDDWNCTCDDDFCIHIVGAVIALRNDLVVHQGTATYRLAHIHYCFTSTKLGVSFDRIAVTEDGKRKAIKIGLQSFISRLTLYYFL